MSLLFTSLLVSAIASLWVWMGGRKDPQGRPWVTVVCLAMLLMLPALTYLPKFQWAVLGEVASVSSGELLERRYAHGWLMWCWLAGVVMMLARLMLGQSLLSKWVRTGYEVTDPRWRSMLEDCADMLQLDEVPAIRLKRGLSSPVVTGLRKPVVMLPESAVGWSEQTLTMAMLHELGHVRRRDLWLRLAADLTCAFHWYNPLVWWLRSRLFVQCEYACDARVVASGVSPKVYLQALCDVLESALRDRAACGALPMGVCAMADHAPLKLRAKRLIHGRPVGSPWLAGCAVLLTIVTAFGLTVLRPAMIQEEGEGELPHGWGGGWGEYSQEEIEMRHSANPFPGS